MTAEVGEDHGLVSGFLAGGLAVVGEEGGGGLGDELEYGEAGGLSGGS